MSGVLWAISAMVGWGFGDFFIQKTVRRMGVWSTLLLISTSASLLLLPFIDFQMLVRFVTTPDFVLLVAAGLIFLTASLLDFEALDLGKISVIEPIIALELPLVALFGYVFLKESLTGAPLIFMLLVFVGVLLAAAKQLPDLHYHKRFAERGVIFAFAGAISLAAVDLLIGFASRETSPVFTIWVMNVVIAACTLTYIIIHRRTHPIFLKARGIAGPIVAACILETGGWIAYGSATQKLPISLAMTITESYVALAVVLGIFLNRERLRTHQIFGALLAIGAVIVLAGMIS